MSEDKKITCAILVKDDSMSNIYESEIYPFLKAHGFNLWALKDYPVCNWIYISLTDKTYIPGIPGIPVTQALGNHAITINEFYEIFHIFEKCDGASILNMSSQKPSATDNKPALTATDEGKPILWEPVPIIATIDLVSQTMDISIDIFHHGEIEEDGEKLFQYRFIAEDEVSMQRIDIDLEDTISEYGINLLCKALQDNSYENDVSAVYSWGKIEFAFAEYNGNAKMILFAYIEGSPAEDDADDALRHNFIYMEFNEKEFEKFRYFILALNAKNNEAKA